MISFLESYGLQKSEAVDVEVKKLCVADEELVGWLGESLDLPIVSFHHCSLAQPIIFLLPAAGYDASVTWMGLLGILILM